MKNKETIKTIVITMLATAIIAFVLGAYYEFSAFQGIQALKAATTQTSK